MIPNSMAAMYGPTNLARPAGFNQQQPAGAPTQAPGLPGAQGMPFSGSPAPQTPGWNGPNTGQPVGTPPMQAPGWNNPQPPNAVGMPPQQARGWPGVGNPAQQPNAWAQFMQQPQMQQAM